MNITMYATIVKFCSVEIIMAEEQAATIVGDGITVENGSSSDNGEGKFNIVHMRNILYNCVCYSYIKSLYMCILVTQDGFK